jgi:hypothetical protein
MVHHCSTLAQLQFMAVKSTKMHLPLLWLLLADNSVAQQHPVVVLSSCAEGY